MKTKSNDEISIISRKSKTTAEKTPPNTEKQQPRVEEKTRLSLASKISSSYNKLFITWMSIAMVVIFFSIALFDFVFVINKTRPHVESIKGLRTQEEIVQAVQGVKDAPLVLINEDHQVLASTFDQASVKSKFPVSFELINNSVYMALSSKLSLPDGMRLILLAYHDITFFLTELIIIGAISILVFAIALVFLYIRGHIITRKTFSVVDELINKANNISSQNLNLRLNVSDSTDELVEFALTFNKMMDRIEKSYEKQNQFVSDASHELRTPIAVIQGYARMLERWGKDDKEILQESISAINKESKNMQDLVDKLLFIARNDRDTLLLVKETFDISSLVNELAKETKMLETGHEVRCFVESDISLYGDRNRIKQALRIFADNALKYTPDGGAITFRLDVSENQAVIVIKDTGMGIPEKDLPNIFDRFYRVDTARERNKGGHGLGLSIARIIILRHGGRIKVASKENEGTRFSIYIPLNQGSEFTEHEMEAVGNISPV